MSIFDLLKKNIATSSDLAASEKPPTAEASASVDSSTERSSTPRYKIGDVIHAAGFGYAYGDFEVVKIHEGGYAHVYIVRVRGAQKYYALKTPQDWCLDDAKALELFTREAEIWIRMEKHPNIVYAHSVLNLYGHPYILLEYVDGFDLWDKMKSDGALPVRAALKYAIQVCRGMRHAQNKLPGFVHRDIKTGNCLITNNGVLKITDFGYAKVWIWPDESPKVFPFNESFRPQSKIFKGLASHEGGGTPPYMSPEQFEDRTDVRSDVYSFGIMLFEMLVGERPFPGHSHDECGPHHKTSIPPDPASLNKTIPPSLANLILRCLAKSPAERPEDFNVLEDELSSLLWDMYQERLPEVTLAELTPEDRVNRGEALMALGMSDEALDCYDQALDVEPQLARAWGHKGDALSGLGRYDEALVCYDQAIKLDLQLALAWNGKGNVLDRLGRHGEALACFNHTLKLNPQLIMAWNNKGRTLANLGRLKEALMSVNRALELEPQYARTHNNLGNVYSALGQHEEAVKAYKLSLALDHRHVEVHNNLGDTYADSGHLWEAVESYKQAINLKPSYQNAHYNLVNTYRKLYQPVIGDRYAELIIAFLSDYKSHLNSDEPIYIIELAASDGALGFHTLRALMSKKTYFSDLSSLKIRYIMTNSMEDDLKLLESHERLQTFQSEGTLDFAVLHPETDDALFLRASQTELNAGSMKNPIITIANYFFSNLDQDLFQISDGVLQEVESDSHHISEGVSPNSPSISDSPEQPETHGDAGAGQYQDSRFNAILDYYKDHLKQANISFPVAALNCIENLQTLSHNNLVLLSLDKGFTKIPMRESQSSEERAPALDLALPYTVNYHALNRYFEDQGGRVFAAADETQGLAGVMCILLSQGDCRLENTRYYFEEKVKKQHLINHLSDFEALLNSEFQNNHKVILQGCLALIRLMNCDPLVFHHCGEKIYRALGEIDRQQKGGLIEILARVRENIYTVEPETDYLFWLGKIYYNLDLYDECLEVFHQSIKLFGPDDDSLYYIAACHQVKGDYEVALDYYRRALAFDPDCELTLEGIKRMEVKLANAGAP